MNSWSFSGNLGKESETRFTQAGEAIVSFSVGVKSGYGDKAKTVWARCTMFGKRGEAVSQYLTKGQLVGVVGELSENEWEKDGQKNKSIEVRVTDLTLLGKKDGQQSSEPRQQQERPAPQRDSGGAPPNKPSFQDLGDDIPFNCHAKGRIGHCM